MPPLSDWLFRMLSGMVAGQLFWGVMLIGGRGFDIDICEILAEPIAVLGWLLVWGDNGPPPLVDQWSFVISSNLAIYGAIGAAIGICAIPESPTPFRVSFRATVVALSAIAIVLALALLTVR